MQHDLTDDRAVSFALGGGNALGAYHLGVCERLFAAGILPSWIAGTSIGAVTGAILVGNPPQTRLARLREFWNRAAQIALPEAPLPPEIRARINNDYALAALLFGRPGLFGSRFPGIWSLLPGMPPDRALRDHAPLARTLEDLIDFDRLNAAPERLSIVALDMETGEEVWFDNRHGAIGPEHLLAATALAPLFPPVEIDGRLLCDAGFGNNLPFDRIFREPPPRETLCIAVDAYTLAHGRPATLDETVARVQDLAFASQTRRALAALARERALERRLDPASPGATLAHLAYRPAGHQRTLKPLDFSRASLDERVEAGLADAEAILDRLARAPRGQPLTYLGPLAPETG
jgi:NTE family protein